MSLQEKKIAGRGWVLWVWFRGCGFVGLEVVGGVGVGVGLSVAAMGSWGAAEVGIGGWAVGGRKGRGKER
ncbi:unnamed protein product [Prunus armeniaca]|nr:unnamed protein product [Prunus armeniaca]